MPDQTEFATFVAKVQDLANNAMECVAQHTEQCDHLTDEDIAVYELSASVVATLTEVVRRLAEESMEMNDKIETTIARITG